MAIFTTKDYNANKSDKIRLAVGRKLGLGIGIQATNNQVNNELEQHLKELVQSMNSANYAAAEPAPEDL